MDQRPEFESGTFEHGGVFDITSLESRAERWRQLLLLALGLASIWLGHEISTWASDPAATSVRLWTTAVIVFGLVEVGRAVARFITSVSSHQTRVFPWRHFATCGACMLAVVVTLVSMLLTRGPFSSLFSRGNVTGEDIADFGLVIATGLCLLATTTAIIAAAAAYRTEHEWRHPQPPRSRGQ